METKTDNLESFETDQEGQKDAEGWMGKETNTHDVKETHGRIYKIADETNRWVEKRPTDKQTDGQTKWPTRQRRTYKCTGREADKQADERTDRKTMPSTQTLQELQTEVTNLRDGCAEALPHLTISHWLSGDTQKKPIWIECRELSSSMWIWKAETQTPPKKKSAKQLKTAHSLLGTIEIMEMIIITLPPWHKQQAQPQRVVHTLESRGVITCMPSASTHTLYCFKLTVILILSSSDLRPWSYSGNHTRLAQLLVLL